MFVSVGVVVSMMVMMPVVMVVSAAAFVFMLMLVRMIMAAAVVAVIVVMTAFVIVIMVMSMIVSAAIGTFGTHRSQIKNAKHKQPNPGDQGHGAENAIRRQVGSDAPGKMEIQQHAAPKQQKRDTDQMGDETVGAHGL